MVARKDSRFRAIQREYGKVFVVWFGGIYSHPFPGGGDGNGGSLFKVGDNVELVEGSTPDLVVLRNPKRTEIGLEKWRRTGLQGGEKAKKKFDEDWARLLAGEKSIGLTPAEGKLGPDHIGNWANYTQEERDAILPPIEKLRPLDPVLLTAPASTERVLIVRDEESSKRAPFSEMFELSVKHESSSAEVGIIVRFRDENNASSFRMAVNRRGWKADEPLRDENSGETVIVVRSK